MTTLNKMLLFSYVVLDIGRWILAIREFISFSGDQNKAVITWDQQLHLTIIFISKPLYIGFNPTDKHYTH